MVGGSGTTVMVRQLDWDKEIPPEMTHHSDFSFYDTWVYAQRVGLYRVQGMGRENGAFLALWMRPEAVFFGEKWYILGWNPAAPLLFYKRMEANVTMSDMMRAAILAARGGETPLAMQFIPLGYDKPGFGHMALVDASS